MRTNNRRTTVGTRFFVALLITFAVTAALLGGAGYGVTQIVVPTPRELFRGPAFDFELARGWWCELDGTEYVCTPPGKPPHAAIAIIALKERDSRDNLQAYEEHLKKQQSSGGPDTGAGQVKRRALGAHEWIEALHVGSEIPNYQTYYLATNTSYLGILVTMSVHEDSADRYIGQLREMISTLKVYGG
jgi:hypothetical protein